MGCMDMETGDMSEDCGMGCATTMCVDYCGGDGNADDECVMGCVDAVAGAMEGDEEDMGSFKKAKAHFSKTMTLKARRFQKI